MGVVGMWEYMQKYARPVDVASLRNKRIAIDGHIWLYEVMRGNVAHCSTTKKPHLVAFYSRCNSLIENGIEPIIVFDSLDEKVRNENAALKKDRKRNTTSWAPELKMEFLTKIEEIKELLSAMGVRWMASKLEGEAQCAQLEKRGLVHGCITRDFDYILFGGNNLYQEGEQRKPAKMVKIIQVNIVKRCCEGCERSDFHKLLSLKALANVMQSGLLMEFNANGTINDNTFLLSMDYIQEKLCLNRSCLIAMSLMMGCDYYQKGIPGVGVVTALEIVSEFYIMQQDHPQVILDRFKAYASKALPLRDTDSLVKKKLRTSSERLTVDLRDFNPNSDVVSNAVNVYMVPCVIDYSRTQLPKKSAPDNRKIQEILQRDSQWDLKHPLNTIEKSFKRQLKSRTLAVIRPRTVVALCSKEEGTSCSKREWAAMERLRFNASQYSFNPVQYVIEVISVPSPADEFIRSTNVSPSTSGNLKRKFTYTGTQQETSTKRPCDNHSLTQSDTSHNKVSSPVVAVRNDEMVAIEEDVTGPSAVGETNAVGVIEEVADKSRFQVIQSTA
uniref:Exonuclease 1 n=1 Tax=Syphacia muris TaxID=451379 RepID=A0A0N5AXY3_9BILA